jgi:hypothetical protein
MLVLHVCALAAARLAMVFSSLSGTQRQCRVVAALAIMEAAALPGTFLGSASRTRHALLPCETVVIAPASQTIEDCAYCTCCGCMYSWQFTYASLASLMRWTGILVSHIVAVVALLQRMPPYGPWLSCMQRSLRLWWTCLTVNEQTVVDDFCKLLPAPGGAPTTVQRAPPPNSCCHLDAAGVLKEQMILGRIRLAEELLLRVKSHELELKSELADILSALACAGES